MAVFAIYRLCGCIDTRGARTDHPHSTWQQHLATQAFRVNLQSSMHVELINAYKNSHSKRETKSPTRGKQVGHQTVCEAMRMLLCRERCSGIRRVCDTMFDHRELQCVQSKWVAEVRSTPGTGTRKLAAAGSAGWVALQHSV